MNRTRFRQWTTAAVLVAACLIPAAAAAQEPRWALRHETGTWGVLSRLWDLASNLLKSEETDHRGQIDPDGVKHRGQMDPNGAPEAALPSDLDHRGQIDPNG